jgi:hypothetical protein
MEWWAGSLVSQVVNGLSSCARIVRPEAGRPQKTTPTRNAGGRAETKVKLDQLVGSETFRLRETQMRPINPAVSTP